MTAKARAADNAFTVVLSAIALLPWIMALVLISRGGPLSDVWIKALFNSSPPLIEMYADRFQSYPGVWETRLGALYLVFLLSPLPFFAGLVFSIKVIDKYRRPFMSFDWRSVFGRVFGGLTLVLVMLYALFFLAGNDMVWTGTLMQTSNSAMLLMTVAGFSSVGALLGLMACDVRSLFQGAVGPNSSLKRTNQSLRD
jgi:hypothetical protein